MTYGSIYFFFYQLHFKTKVKTKMKACQIPF